MSKSQCPDDKKDVLASNMSAYAGNYYLHVVTETNQTSKGVYGLPKLVPIGLSLISQLLSFFVSVLHCIHALLITKRVKL